MAVYFTKLKALYEELNNFKPSCSCGKCTCGGLKDLNAYFQIEYVMTFLMGLNDSFAQIRGQLLLLDPIPPINKVFSLVSQEERHRSVSFQATSNVIDPANNMAFAVRSEGVKKNSLISLEIIMLATTKDKRRTSHSVLTVITQVI